MRRRTPPSIFTGIGVAIAIVASAAAVMAGMNYQGMNYQGMNYQGMNYQGMNYQGMNYQGMNYQGMNYQGMNYQGMNYQGMNYQGMNYQGMNYQGMNYQGMNYQGMNYQGMNYQGMNYQGMNYQGMNYQGMNYQGGVDRPWNFVRPVQLRGVARADVTISGTLQGLQTKNGLAFSLLSNPMANVRLQFGPTGSATDTAAGSFISNGDPTAPITALKGTIWSMVLADSCNSTTPCPGTETCADGWCSGVDGGVPLYIADVEVDRAQNSSKYPSNDDIYLYTVYFRQPTSGQWASLCPVDSTTGKPTAMAVPLSPFDHSEVNPSKFTFACTASGVAAKCARNWGYKPWKKVHETAWNPALNQFVDNTEIDLAPFYDACLVAARASYCQDDQSFTKNGTLVDLFDTIDGVTSINATAGLPYAPYASGPMMHEEYQISTGHFVAENFTPDVLASMPDKALVSGLRRSGMESSRYADLDPGRSCPASPYIDRCDPKEPYACYRATNMRSGGYGAFIAVNSPHHCEHNEATEGPALDPLCNECVNRICQIDPRCCGDPGSTPYPGSLVWDDTCVAIQEQVCRSSADGPVWPSGSPAPLPGSHTTPMLRGAIGSFEGIVHDGSDDYAEGWACDPDFPGASIPVQISISGAPGGAGSLGATGTTLFTTAADRPLIRTWRDEVAAECGGAGRHGFRFALPTGSTAKNVFIYGIDLNVPGAPFSLLRGGAKTVPAAGAVPTPPRAAIWTGWLEPPAPGDYAFSADTNADDQYRVWVDGVYVAGNWTDTDTETVKGEFTLPSPPPTTVPLLPGATYGVRVEYRRPSTSTGSPHFTLSWSSANAPLAAQPIDKTALHPFAQTTGSGLEATYFQGTFGSNGLGGGSTGVDQTWTRDVPPVTGIDVTAPFAATFRGQVVPPITGDYTFTTDGDGSTKIWLRLSETSDEWTLVTDASPLNPGTCAHDICAVGGPLSRTCDEGYFCSGMICLKDPRCCSQAWDARCVDEVKQICGFDCHPTPPQIASLRAGSKYDIYIEYQHQNGRGAKFRVFWALPGTPRDLIPTDRLFASATPRLSGIGINGAYFSDETFTTEYLDRVAPALDFPVGSWPGASMSSIVCADGDLACDTVPTPGAPSLVLPAEGSRVSGPSVTVRGQASRDAIVKFYKCDPDTDACDTQVGDPVTASGGTTACDKSAASGVDCGAFTASLPLSRGPQRLAARQSVGGVQGPLSARISFTVIDEVAPPPPTVTAPPAGLVAGTDGNVSVGGTASPNAKVKVTATAPGGATVTTTTDANASGAWNATLVLGPGSYTITVVDASDSSHPSDPTAARTVTVPFLPIILTAPANPTTTTTPVVRVTGDGARSDLEVIVADGNKRFSDTIKRLAPDGTGHFDDEVTLDYGLHQLKVFQRRNGLDGEGATASVSIVPLATTLAITSPAVDATVDLHITVEGSGGLTRSGPTPKGLPGSVIVYQGNAKVGEGPLTDAGTFSIPVTLTGAGIQFLSISQVARSLSGAGSAESDRTPVAGRRLFVRPPAPVIAAPVPGTVQDSLTVTVKGTTFPNSTVVLYEGNQAISPPITPDPLDPNAPRGTFPSFSTTLGLTDGTHRLTAVATVTGAESAPSVPSAPVVVTVGDVTPPKIYLAGDDGVSVPELVVTLAAPPTVTDTHVPPRPVGGIVITDADDTTAVVDFSTRVVATDSGASLSATCVPASGSKFLLGSTYVTCTAKDAKNNTGSGTFTITLLATTAPSISATDLTAEAEGPDGAAVNYQVTATGLIADCAVPGAGHIEPCVSWSPASTGLGFEPKALAQDQNDGTFYAGFQGFTFQNNLLRSDDDGATWTQTAAPGPDKMIISQIVVAGSPPVVYIPGPQNGGGITISRDRGATWSSVLTGKSIALIAADPANPGHMLAATDTRVSAPAVYETTDGWESWTFAGQNLPAAQILSIGIDPVSGRAYAAVAPASNDDFQTIVYVRVGAGSWQRAAIPSFYISRFGTAAPIVVAPATPGQTTIPPVFAGTVVSRDGGVNWDAVTYCDTTGFCRKSRTDGTFTFTDAYGPLVSIVFDQANPQRLFGTVQAGYLFSSIDGGLTWTQTSTAPRSGFYLALQDRLLPSRLYAIIAGINAGGLYYSDDDGVTWQPVSAPNLSLPGELIRDLAVDPVDPRTAYLLSGLGGVFKTTDGGDHWIKRNGGDAGRIEPGAIRYMSKVAVDGINRNLVTVGAEGLWRSANAGGAWADLATGRSFQLFALNPFAIDPLVSGGVVLMGGIDGDQVFRTTEIDSDYSILHLRPDGSYREFVSRSGFDVEDQLVLYRLQVVPSASRFVIASGVGTVFGSGSVAQIPENGPLDSAEAFRVAWLASVTFDRSDGVDRIFAGGGALERDATRLYSRTIAAHASDSRWEPIGDAGGPFFSDFSKLVVDPVSGGRTMYTVGADNSFWQSEDGGAHWRKDDKAPRYLTQAWLSPVDGAIYATVAVGPTDISADFYQRGENVRAHSVLWKRSPATKAPAGARIVQGTLRPICVGPGGGASARSVGPGATFPIGTTTLQCTATDIFGHPKTEDLTVIVTDHTPPTITVPSGLTIVAQGDGKNTYPFTATATDLVDGDRPVICQAYILGATPPVTVTDSLRYPIGVTPIVCSASDLRGNTAHAQFEVVIWPSSNSPVSAPTLYVAQDQTVEATGPDGVTLPLDSIQPYATNAAGTQIEATCSRDLTAPFHLGTTEVTCSITSDGVTLNRSFRVTVRDTTPPELQNIPGDIGPVSSTGPNGVAVTFTPAPSAFDTVDLTNVHVDCVPGSGAVFPFGTTLVTCRASDAAGNRATGTFRVTVTGHPPTLSLPNVVEVHADDRYGASVSYASLVSATDTLGVALQQDCLSPVGFCCIPPSGLFPLGETTVACIARDTFGESTASFKVRVIDATGPTVSVPEPITKEADGPEGTTVEFTVDAFDTVDGAIKPPLPTPTCPLGRAPSCQRITSSGAPVPVASGATFPIGETTVACTATDCSGNVGSPAELTITVRDTTPPTLHLPGAVTDTADASGTKAVPFVATATDTVSGELPAGCTPKPGDRFPIGITTVTCIARDGAGNQADGSFTVTVAPNTQLAPNGQPCTANNACASNHCVDGVCCNTTCGTGSPSDANDCQACSVAAGGSTDGTCLPLAPTRVCRDKAGACDVAETCDGASPACPSDAKATSGTTCRVKAGDCDVADACNGTSNDCPVDAFVAAGTTCRTKNGDCDVADACNGSSPACPDAKVTAGTICRAKADTCDVAETCNGIANDCPVDAFATGTTCRAKNGDCDVADACNGSSAACPDAKVTAGTICRAKADTCDVAETCNGIANDCPVDAFATGTTCRARNGACDVAETCSGNSAACPADALAAAGTVCAPSPDSCHAAAVCNGTVATCPPPPPISGCCSTDKTAPVFSNVPGTIVAYATCTAGAVVTYTKPTASDAVDGDRLVTCTPASGSMFAPGKTDVICTATDKCGNKATAKFTVWVKYQAPTDGSFFLQPINPDGSSIFKKGSTVPVKFKLVGASEPITDLVAKIVVTKVSNNVTGTSVEAMSTSAADSGSTFRYDAANKQYIFNLSTTSMAPGTWSLRADLGDLVDHVIKVSLR